MKILIVHMRYHPDSTGTAPLVTQLAQDLASKGDEVRVIASLPHYGRDSVHPDYRDFPGFFHRKKEVGVELIRTPVYIPRRPSILFRAWNYISYNFLSIIAGLSAHKTDVVLAINPPITTTFAAWIISVFHRAPLVVGIQDVWPDCLIQVDKIRNPILIIASKMMEKFQYRISNQIIVLSQGMKNNLLSKGVDPEKIQVIANWADTDQIMQLPKENDFYKEHGLEGKFVILFAGNHGYISSLEYVVQAAKILQDKPDLQFLLVGEGSVKKDLMDLASRLELQNVKFLPTQPDRKWLEMLAAADIGIVSLRSNLAGLNVPSKVYTLMAAGKPILATVPENSEVARVVREAKSGIICKPDDPEDLARAILMAQNQGANLSTMGINGRNYMQMNNNRGSQTARYSAVLRSVRTGD